MSLGILAQLISLTATILTILVLVWVLASWIMPPYHPLRTGLDRLVDPLLSPIRRVLPATGPIDFSPLVLIIVIELAARILNGLVLSL
jgi:YggT family protein